jgi:hypothetical protein
MVGFTVFSYRDDKLSHVNSARRTRIQRPSPSKGAAPLVIVAARQHSVNDGCRDRNDEACLRHSGPRILGPVVAGVPPGKLLANGRIKPYPKSG